ncbi:unnamed protein product [Caenorhabditis sp. 36 PRJEB53466]|nr:unnamed protein product [Caenorhabditis sp. 36 PRJEB53466]
MSTGCVRNKFGSVFCVCNSSSYCNEMTEELDYTEMTYLTCTEQSSLLEPSNCSATFCLNEYNDYGKAVKSCVDDSMDLGTYEYGFTMSNLFLPLNSCYTIENSKVEYTIQICAFKTVISCVFSVNNSTCVGQLCFSADRNFGCISQSNREGAVLKTGLYHLTPFIAPFHICDSNFCNNETMIDEDRYAYPTTYQWASAASRKCWSLYVLSAVWTLRRST